jgi:hypothetical protein
VLVTDGLVQKPADTVSRCFASISVGQGLHRNDSWNVMQAGAVYCPCPASVAPMDLANMRSLGVTRIDASALPDAWLSHPIDAGAPNSVSAKRHVAQGRPGHGPIGRNTALRPVVEPGTCASPIPLFRQAKRLRSCRLCHIVGEVRWSCIDHLMR